ETTVPRAAAPDGTAIRFPASASARRAPMSWRAGCTPAREETALRGAFAGRRRPLATRERCFESRLTCLSGRTYLASRDPVVNGERRGADGPGKRPQRRANNLLTDIAAAQLVYCLQERLKVGGTIH